MRLFLLVTIVVAGCATSQDRAVGQLIRDNGAGEDFQYGWYHDTKALQEFENEARACAGEIDVFYNGRSDATVAAEITQCLVNKGWRTDGLLEVVILH